MFLNKMTNILYTIIIFFAFSHSYAENSSFNLSRIPNKLIPSLQKNDCMCSFLTTDTEINKPNVLFVTGLKFAFGYINGNKVIFEHLKRTKKEKSFINKYKLNDIEIILKSEENGLNKLCKSYHEEINHMSCYSSQLQVFKKGNNIQSLNGVEVCGC